MPALPGAVAKCHAAALLCRSAKQWRSAPVKCTLTARMTPKRFSRLMLAAWLALAGLLAFTSPPQQQQPRAGDQPGMAGALEDGTAVPLLLALELDEETSLEDAASAEAPADAPPVPQAVCPSVQQRQRARVPSPASQRVNSCMGARGPPRLLPAG